MFIKNVDYLGMFDVNVYRIYHITKTNEGLLSQINIGVPVFLFPFIVYFVYAIYEFK